MTARTALSPEQRRKLSEAMYAIHRRSVYYQGLTEAGEMWLNAGKSIGPDKHQLPIAEGMKAWSCCKACQHHGKGDQWPCETVRLLLEAGILLPVEDLGAGPAVDGPSIIITDSDNASANIRPDRRTEIHRW